MQWINSLNKMKVFGAYELTISFMTREFVFLGNVYLHSAQYAIFLTKVNMARTCNMCHSLNTYTDSTGNFWVLKIWHGFSVSVMNRQV